MDEGNDVELDPGARRREQNRLAQRNFRRRRQLEQQEQSAQFAHGEQQDSSPRAELRQSQDCSKDRGTDVSNQSELLPIEDFLVPDSHAAPMRESYPPDLDTTFNGLVEAVPMAHWMPWPSSTPQIDRSSLENDLTKTPGTTTEIGIGVINEAATGRHLDSLSKRRRQATPTQPLKRRVDRLLLGPEPISEAKSYFQHISRRSRNNSSTQQLSKAPYDKLPSPISVDLNGRDTCQASTLNTQRSRQNSLHHAISSSYEPRGQTCLHIAAEKGSSYVVQYLLNLGMLPETRDADGLTALHYASRGGHKETVGDLLNKGVDMEATDNFGRTALHLAVECMHEDVVVLLIQSGADFQAKVL